MWGFILITEVHVTLIYKHLTHLIRWFSICIPAPGLMIWGPPEDPLEEEMDTHSRILAWRIPWTEEPGGLQSMGLQSWTRLSAWHAWVMVVIFSVRGPCDLICTPGQTSHLSQNRHPIIYCIYDYSKISFERTLLLKIAWKSLEWGIDDLYSSATYCFHLCVPQGCN